MSQLDEDTHLSSLEWQRLQSLYAYHILDSEAEADFDDITRLASQVCRVPIALISLVDAERQWFKSKVGLPLTETPRRDAFCTHTIQQDTPLIIEDAALDPRFAISSLVVNAPHIRFYAGVPLVVPDGQRIGTLCVIDTVPRRLTPEQLELLRMLSHQVVKQLELRKRYAELRVRETRLQTILDNQPTCVKLIDANGVLLEMNAAGLALVEGTTDLIGQCVYSLIAPEDLAAFKAFNQRVCQGQADTLEFDLISCRGTRRTVESRAVPLVVAADGRIAHLAVTRDITPLKQAEISQKTQQERTQIITAVAHRIRRSLDLQEILDTTVEEVRQILRADRVVTYRTNPEGTGEVITEAVAPGCSPILGRALPSHMFPLACYEQYQRGRIRCVTDIEQDEMADCLRDTLRQIGVKAKLVVPILHDDYLWGLLVAHQCQHTRQWQPWEIDWLQQLAAQVAIAVHQAALYQQAQTELTEHKHTQAALLQSEARYRLIAENGRDLVCLHSLDGRYTYVSPSCQALLGYDSEALMGQPLRQFCHPDDWPQTQQNIEQAIVSEEPEPITYRLRQRTGDYLWLEMLVRPITDSMGTVVGWQTCSRDVTERVALQTQLLNDARHDHLTRLPNRSFLIERLERALASLKADAQQCFAVLFLDVDRFKVINDSLGHLIGDELLQAVAERLKTLVRPTDFMARLGGDEFVIVAASDHPISAMKTLATTIGKAFQQPLQVRHYELFITLSIGILMGNSTYHNAADLLRDADLSMYQAKANGKNRYEVFKPAMHLNLLQRLKLETDLRKALDCQELTLRYQPIFALDTITCTGFETLVRWEHPKRGLISPDNFIPTAEESGLIVPLGFWIMEKACEQMVRWQQTYPAAQSLKLSVNLSVRQLQAAALLPQIEHILASTGMPPNCLVLELTESLLVEHSMESVEILKQLRSWGIQISIDDFGTGYSSLSYLYRMPVDTLKIDKSFVRGVQDNLHHQKVLETMITLGRQLDLGVVAEGIETQQQLAVLWRLGCQLGQGYLFSKPLMAEAIPPIFLTE